jgi:hypothetical protein
MSTTFAARLASDEGRDLRKYVTIEGVRAILQDGDEDVPAALIASSRTRVRCITALEQDRRELDMVARREGWRAAAAPRGRRQPHAAQLVCDAKEKGDVYHGPPLCCGHDDHREEHRRVSCRR